MQLSPIQIATRTAAVSALVVWPIAGSAAALSAALVLFAIAVSVATLSSVAKG